MESKLRQLIDAHQLSCGVVISRQGEFEARCGDYAKFESMGLMGELIGDQENARRLFESVQGEGLILPTIWSQGDEFAIVDRRDDLVIVVFGRTNEAALSRYHLSRQVAQSISQLFSI